MAGARYFSSLHKVQTSSGHTQTPAQLLAAVYSGVKRPGLESEHSPTTTAEVKNAGAISSFPHMTLWRCA
jgi:hypothetical protein